MTARHLRTESVTDDDIAIRTALATVSVPALVASVVCLTGDPALLHRTARPRAWIHNEFQGAMTDAEKVELRDAAAEAVCRWRDRGCPPPPPTSAHLEREVMNWIACEPVSEEYLDLYSEELDLRAENPRAISLEAGVTVPDDFGVLVIGCGEGGLLAAIRLQEAGIPFTVVDKNTDVGGTWWENQYPGCRVDVASHFYSYSFEDNTGFEHYYAARPEVHAYLRQVFDDHRIEDHVRWGQEVTAAQWDDEQARWSVTVRTSDGNTTTLTANAVISAVGILNRPALPPLPGLDQFAGPVFHSSRWDHSVDLTGRSVALVGAGASGFQIGPAIVDEVSTLTVFQRTPQWMAPNPRYHAEVAAGERWAFRHLPTYSRWYRFMLMWQSSDKMLELVRADPEWPDFPQTANALSAARREVLVSAMAGQIRHDDALLSKVVPHYPPMAKRMLQDDGSWLACLQRDHVELVTDPITDVGRHSISTADTSHDVDIIVLATGFRASEVLLPMTITGRDGVDLHDVWRGRPRAFNGVSVPGFPNFFMIGGPGTGLAHAGSVVTMSEFQMRYIGAALARLLDSGFRRIEPTRQAYDAYTEELQREVATLMWGHPSIEHSWYKSADGGVHVLSPWRLVDYWRRTAVAADSDHYIS